MTNHLNDDDRLWLNEYADSVMYMFSTKFKENEDRFKEGNHLLKRFQASIEEVINKGRDHFSAVDEAHNELCIAVALLGNKNPQFLIVRYEPLLPNIDKTIDFFAESQAGPAVYVDVKTIKPLPKDRWDQYERAIKEKWFPKNVSFTVDKEWLGGELWHNAFAARARMLEYTLELEQKIAQAQLAINDNRFVLAFCGEGFPWHEDELEDFVAFYSTGRHRVDDPFSLAENNYIKEQQISLSRSVSQFAYLQRPQGELLHKKLNWNVRPPTV